ncbi:MAG: phage Gp37/Gp68 family protein [Sphingomonas sp.]|nr:MAG: phage Gp37/Gp68 family protein [Sphingomonas sp.]
MADNSAIEWTDATVNFWWGCTKVGPGCDHCYAEAWSKRTGESIWGLGAPRRKIKSAVSTLARLKAETRVFLQSMSDLFDIEVPIEWFAEAWAAIASRPDLRVQIVTKRISVVEKRVSVIGGTWPANAGLIISVINQAEADRDIPRLIALKAKLCITWIGLSMEPLLGGVVLRPEWLEHLNWVIVGGESGPDARPMHPEWVRSLRDQCAEAAVPFFFKQWGNCLPGSMDGEDERGGPAWQLDPEVFGDDYYPDGFGRGREISAHGQAFIRFGRKPSCALIDGSQHREWPRSQPT